MPSAPAVPYGPWVAVWKRRMARWVDQHNTDHPDAQIDVPAGFRARTWYWGEHAQALATSVKAAAGVPKPDGRLDGALRRILRHVKAGDDLTPPYLGIDVSNHQATIDWHAVASDAQHVRFAWLKATEGRTFVDAYYGRNRRETADVGITSGAYSFVHPGTVDQGIAQMAHLLRTAGYKPGDLAPVIDWELEAAATPSQRPTLEACAVYLRRKTGAWPVIYGGAYVLGPMNLDRSSPLASCPLWLPAYGPNDGKRHPTQIPTVPQPWRTGSGIAVHQYTSNGTVDGVPGPVDMNHALAPLSTLRGAR